MRVGRLLTILALAGCADREEPRVSLGGRAERAAPNDAVHQGVTQDTPQPGTLPAAAKAALDSGNAQYRAGKYEGALASYRAAAKAAPTEAAPWFGIYMAASKLGRAKEAAEAQAKINELSGDSSALAPHAAPTKKPPATSAQ